MRGYSLYVFDFDNTLFDSTSSMEAMLSAGMGAVGLRYDRSQFPLYAGKTVQGIFESLPGGPFDRDAFMEAFQTVADSDAYMSAVPFPETAGVLKELRARGRSAGIASGKRTYKIERLLRMFGLEDLFGAVVGYDDTKRHKPDPEPVAAACGRFDAPKENILYIGDSPSDCAAAGAYGVDCAIVDRDNGLTRRGIPSTYTIGSLEELLEGWR